MIKMTLHPSDIEKPFNTIFNQCDEQDFMAIRFSRSDIEAAYRRGFLHPAEVFQLDSGAEIIYTNSGMRSTLKIFRTTFNQMARVLAANTPTTCVLDKSIASHILTLMTVFG